MGTGGDGYVVRCVIENTFANIFPFKMYGSQIKIF